MIDGSGPPAAEARLSEGGRAGVDVAVEVVVEGAEVAEVAVVEEGEAVVSRQYSARARSTLRRGSFPPPAAACLAASSAISFPGSPLCALTCSIRTSPPAVFLAAASRTPFGGYN